MAKTTPDELRAVTARVLDAFTSAGMLFTALDVSNAVKRSLPDIRHREVSPIVRDVYARAGMGTYSQTLIDVTAEGRKPAQAYLYHLPEHPTSNYDDSMRSQVAIPPVSTAAGDDDMTVTDATTEALVPVGKDGRGRVSRHLLKNAGISGDKVLVKAQAVPPKLEIRAGGVATEVGQEVVSFEHPSLLHIPKNLIGVFDPGTQLLARIEGAVVTIKGLN